MTWEDSASTGEFDFSYGIDAAVRPTSDISTLPKTIWGKVKTQVSGWGIAAKAKIQGTDYSNPRFIVDADNEELDLSVSFTAGAYGLGRASSSSSSKGKSSSSHSQPFALHTVQATKGFDSNGARVTVTPRYNFDTDFKDVVVNYENEATSVKLVASATAQEVTFSQQVDEDNRISPTLSSKGDVSVEWERKIGDDSAVKANFKPNDNLSVEWKDSDWTACVKMPVDGTNINGATVSIKRDVQF